MTCLTELVVRLILEYVIGTELTKKSYTLFTIVLLLDELSNFQLLSFLYEKRKHLLPLVNLFWLFIYYNTLYRCGDPYLFLSESLTPNQAAANLTGIP